MIHSGSNEPHVASLANGVRLACFHHPRAETASVSAFVRAGSGHESKTRNGLSHVVEHMVFKGTATRDVQRINLDAERLGAEVNAHTDKDHTAFHLRGLARDTGLFVQMLADIVLQPSFPADEFERERQVLLHEFTEDEDDPMSTAFKLFDRACWGQHALAQPVIGTRKNIERFTRDDLVEHVQRQYVAPNLVLAVASPMDPEAVLREAEAAFGAAPAGLPNTLAAPGFVGGLRTKAMAGSSQSHVVLGFAVPGLAANDVTAALAAAVFGEGMSSPLLGELREKRGLMYYAACSADALDGGGQFIVDASTAPEQLDEFVAELARLLAAQAERIAPIDLERGRNQLLVRRLRQLEEPGRRLEAAALDLFVHGRVRAQADWREALQALDAPALQRSFEQMLAGGAALAVSGRVPRGASERLRQAVAPHLRLA
ncbi:MAG: insulinase family protein [Burkholderiaceae bacterium]|nr:insulinase family protein [Burkholderiaceae bacterium]